MFPIFLRQYRQLGNKCSQHGPVGDMANLKKIYKFQTVENGIISSNDNKVGMIMTAWDDLTKDAEGFYIPGWQRMRSGPWHV